MKLLIKIEEFKDYKSRDLLPLECKTCNKTFYRAKHYIQAAIKNLKIDIHTYDFCSKICQSIGKQNGKIYKCSQCNKEVYKSPTYANDKRKKSNRIFCSQRCSGLYNSQHKTSGYRRSKLEKYLEQELNNLYPNLKIKYNDTSAILAELDIFIPSLKLGFELNGPLHYEPIFGLDKLTEIQKRDKRKILTCAENNIELVIIDSSTLKYFKPENAKKFLDMITKIINSKLVLETGHDPVNYLV